MISNGADVNIKDNNGETPLHLAAGSWTLGATSPHMRLPIVQELISSGAQVNIENKYGQKPFHKALVGGYPEIVDYFIDRLILINTGNKNSIAGIITKNENGIKRKISDVVRSNNLRSRRVNEWPFTTRLRIDVAVFTSNHNNFNPVQ